MNKILLLAVVTLTFLMPVQLKSSTDVPVATREWVKQYVSSKISEHGVTEVHKNGVTVFRNGRATISYEDATVYALMTTNATRLATQNGITNGMYFVWNDQIHSYTNHEKAITATRTNFVWNGVQSLGSVFSNYFSVVSFILQPSYAKEVTK